MPEPTSPLRGSPSFGSARASSRSPRSSPPSLAGISTGSFDVVGVSWCLYAGIFLLLPMSRARWATRAVPARVEVRDDRLLVDGASVLPLRAVSSAFVLPGDGSGPILRLERRRRPAIELRVRDNGHAAALMRAMGLGPTQWAQCYQLPAPGPALWLWPAALLVALFALVFPFEAELLGKLRYLYITLPGMSGDACFLAVLLLQVAFVVLVAVAGFRAFRTRLVVGADGISLVRMRRARFLPMTRSPTSRSRSAPRGARISRDCADDRRDARAQGIGLARPAADCRADRGRQGRGGLRSGRRRHAPPLLGDAGSTHPCAARPRPGDGRGRLQEHAALHRAALADLREQRGRPGGPGERGDSRCVRGSTRPARRGSASWPPRRRRRSSASPSSARRATTTRRSRRRSRRSKPTGSWRRTRRAERRRRSARRRLMPEPTSPFERVSILRLRPRFFALAALILAVPAYLLGRFPAWWGWQDPTGPHPLPRPLLRGLGGGRRAVLRPMGEARGARPRRGARGPLARRRSLGPPAPRHLFGIRRPRRWLGPDPASRAPSSPCD